MNIINDNTKTIKEYFINALASEDFIMDRTGQKTIEMIGANFYADSPAIFGEPNASYIEIEKSFETYDGLIANIISIQSEKIIKKEDLNCETITNKGYDFISKEYHHQYGQVLDELLANPDGRRASMIYTRPSIWMEYNEDGKNDFICTNAVTYYIRDNWLQSVVQMRSNDVVFGYKNDYAWQLYVLEQLVKDYNDCKENGVPELKAGDLIWQVQNLHVYERHFHLVK